VKQVYVANIVTLGLRVQLTMVDFYLAYFASIGKSQIRHAGQHDCSIASDRVGPLPTALMIFFFISLCWYHFGQAGENQIKDILDGRPTPSVRCQ
jgi:hypothetical protein